MPTNRGFILSLRSFSFYSLSPKKESGANKLKAKTRGKVVLLEWEWNFFHVGRRLSGFCHRNASDLTHRMRPFLQVDPKKKYDRFFFLTRGNGDSNQELPEYQFHSTVPLGKFKSFPMAAPVFSPKTSYTLFILRAPRDLDLIKKEEFLKLLPIHSDWECRL